MKKIYTLFIASFVSAIAFAQIPNSGFETWVSNSESSHTYTVPQSWISSDALETELNDVFGNPGYVVNSVTQSASSHSGNYAVQLSVAVSNQGDTVAGALISEPSAVNFLNYAFGGPNNIGFPFTARPANLTGFRMFNRVGGDSAGVDVIMTKWNSSLQQRDTIAVIMNYYFTTPVSSYTAFSIPLSYYSTQNPDTCLIVVAINATIPHPGTTFTFDDLAFSGTVSGINETVATSFVSVFPNPFTTETTLNFNGENLNHASLEIYDVLGNKVRVITDINGDKITFSREGLNSGIYFYSLINENAIIASGKISVQ